MALPNFTTKQHFVPHSIVAWSRLRTLVLLTIALVVHDQAATTPEVGSQLLDFAMS